MGFFILSYGYMENRVPNDSDKKKDNSNNTKEQQQKTYLMCSHTVIAINFIKININVQLWCRKTNGK